MKKKSILLVVVGIVLALVIGFVALATNRSQPVPISQIIKNEQSYEAKKVNVKGNIVLMSSVLTPDGVISFYALKDSTGQIPIQANTSGVDSDSIVEFTAIVGKVCVQGTLEPANQTVACSKTETGLIEQ